jgi:hypothetical protein
MPFFGVCKRSKMEEVHKMLIESKLTINTGNIQDVRTVTDSACAHQSRWSDKR